MSQQSGRSCSTCGTPAPAGQRFCSNCGTDLSASGPASQYAGSPPQTYPSSQPVQSIPPYAQAPYTQYQQPPQQSSPLAEAFGALGLLFLLRRFRPGYRPRRQSSGCCGCLIVLFIFLVIFGIPTYIAAKNNPQFVQQIQQSSGSNGSGGIPVTQPPITTVPINQTVNYAGVDITILSAQQSNAFLNDNSTATNGMVRLNIKETNNSGKDTGYFFSDMAHLILPNKSSVGPVNELQASGPATSITRNNWLDFAVPTSDKISQLTLLLGTSQEAQISIPLTGRANLSAFQPETINPNTLIAYGGLNWTLQTATRRLNVGGTQVAAGMRYIILTFKIDNPTSGDVVIGFTDEYMRLKSGDTASASMATTFPLTINAQTNGITGTVTFLMPENDTAFTLAFLAQSDGTHPSSSVQVNANFTIA